MLELVEALVLADDAAGCSDEQFWAAVYPGKAYNGNLLNRLLSEMISELKGYLSLLRYQQDPAAKQINLLREYRHRGWQDIVPKALKEVRRKFDSELPQDERYFYHRLQLAIEQLDYDQDHLGKEPGPIYQDILDQLDSLYLIEKLKYDCNANLHERLHSATHTRRFSSIFEEVYQYDELLQDFKTQLFLKYYQSISDFKNEDLFADFCQTLLQLNARGESNPRQHFSFEEGNFFFLQAINFCTQRLNRGETKWIDTYIQLNFSALDGDYFSTREFLDERSFMNISAVMSKFDRDEECKNFIRQYGTKLKNGLENPAFDLTVGVNYFFNGDHQACLTHLLQAKRRLTSKTDFVVELNLRGLLCRIWYELDDLESMVYEVHSYRAFLSRLKKFSKSRIKSYGNFCKYLLRLERVIHVQVVAKRYQKLGEFSKKIQSEENLAHRDWLKQVVAREMNKAAPKT